MQAALAPLALDPQITIFAKRVSVSPLMFIDPVAVVKSLIRSGRIEWRRSDSMESWVSPAMLLRAQRISAIKLVSLLD